MLQFLALGDVALCAVETRGGHLYKKKIHKTVRNLIFDVLDRKIDTLWQVSGG